MSDRPLEVQPGDTDGWDRILDADYLAFTLQQRQFLSRGSSNRSSEEVMRALQSMQGAARRGRQQMRRTESVRQTVRGLTCHGCAHGTADPSVGCGRWVTTVVGGMRHLWEVSVTGPADLQRDVGRLCGRFALLPTVDVRTAGVLHVPCAAQPCVQSLPGRVSAVEDPPESDEPLVLHTLPAGSSARVVPSVRMQLQAVCGLYASQPNLPLDDAFAATAAALT